MNRLHDSDFRGASPGHLKRLNDLNETVCNRLPLKSYWPVAFSPLLAGGRIVLAGTLSYAGERLTMAGAAR